MSNLSNGSLERKVKGELRERWRLQNKPCAYCRQPIDYKAHKNDPRSFNAAHIYPASTHPHLAYDPQNYAPSHRECNIRAQAQVLTAHPWVEANWG